MSGLKLMLQKGGRFNPERGRNCAYKSHIDTKLSNIDFS